MKKTFTIFGYKFTIESNQPNKINEKDYESIRKNEKDYESIRKLELHSWIRYGNAPSLEDMDRYNREILGHTD
jgi:hypothetical protein